MDNKNIIQMEQVSDNESLELSDIEQCVSDHEFYKSLQSKFPKDLHQKLMLNLTHEKLEEAEAKLLWGNIISHLKTMNAKLNRSVGLTVAAMDYITNISNKDLKPILIDEEKSRDIINSATTDDLTKLYTREFFDAALIDLYQQCKEKKQPISFIMIDIDDFKIVNDKYGHQTGDFVLKEIGKIIKKNIRDDDIAARYGGEELVIIVPESSTIQSKKIAERIRKQVEKNLFDKDLTVTVSIGISQMKLPFNTIHSLIKCADSALYKSKANGKNQITMQNCELN